MEMNYTVRGLSPDPFIPLYGLSDAELVTHRARRVVVDGPGFPERVELRDAEPGGYRFSSILLGIVKSVPFQMRRSS